LQLLTTKAAHPELVEAFLVRAHSGGAETAKLRVYHSSLSGAARYGVIYGDYASRNDAIDDLRNLPPALRTHDPYARQVIQLR
jgi:septal ring-binding cell division protein DamX